MSKGRFRATRCEKCGEKMKEFTEEREGRIVGGYRCPECDYERIHVSTKKMEK